MYTVLYIKYPSLFSDFNEILVFLTDFRESLKYNTSLKSVQMGAALCHAVQTDRHDVAISRFLQLCERA